MPYFLYLYIHYGHLGYSPILAIVNNAVKYMTVLVSVGEPDFNTFGQILRSVIDGSHDNSIFNFLRILHILSLWPNYVSINTV